MAITVDEKFITALPKTDLHLHLDGSLRLSTLIELAKVQKVKLPSYTQSGLKRLVYKDSYTNLSEYLHGFKFTCAVMQDPEALERIAYELAEDCWKEGVRYIEVRFAPQLHVHDTLSIKEVFQAVDRGLSAAKQRFNASAQVKKGGEPPFEYGIISIAMRMFNPKFSKFYNKLTDVLNYAPAKSVFSTASLQLAQASVAIRDTLGLPIVGFDLAGQEYGYPADDHRAAYAYAHRHFLKKTVHAGEAYGPESIFQAITDLNADRIGHGLHLFNRKFMTLKQEKEKTKYIKDLAGYISDRRITVEVCLTSNLQTYPSLKSIKNHSFGKMFKNRISATICTDNRLVSQTSVTKELRLAIDHFNLSPSDLCHIIIYGFKRSFFPGPYLEKRRYVHSVIDYYEKVEKKFGITRTSSP